MKQLFIAKPRARSEIIDRARVEPGLTLHDNNPYSLTLQIRTRTKKQGRMSLCSLTKADCLELALRLLEFSRDLEIEGGAS